MDSVRLGFAGSPPMMYKGRMEQKFIIREATFADLVALQALGNAGMPGYFERCFEEQREGRRDILVAVQAEQITGYVFLNYQPRYKPFRRLGIPEIQDLFVRSEARRRGVGEALVQACEARARAKGCSDMGIAVGLHAGFGSAQRLYARLGYIPDGAGIMYDREAVHMGDMRIIDDDLTLMMLKPL